MQDRDLIKQLKSLNQIKPEASWQKAQRVLLLAQFGADQKPEKTTLNLFQWLFSRSFLHSPVIVFLLLIFLISGSIATYTSAQEALPSNNIIFKVKVTLEQARIALSFSANRKAELEVERVAKRTHELGKVMEKMALTPQENKREEIGMAVDQVKSGVQEVRKRLAQVKERDNASQAVALAQYVDEKIKDCKQVLNQTAGQLTQKEVNEKIYETLNLIDETNLAAVEVAVEKMVMADLKSKEEVAAVNQLLEHRISEIKEQVAQKIDQNILDNPQVKVAIKSIEEAQDYLKNNELKLALEKVKEVHQLVQGQVVTENKEASLDNEGVVKGEATTTNLLEQGENKEQFLNSVKKQSTSTQEETPTPNEQEEKEFKVIIGY